MMSSSVLVRVLFWLLLLPFCCRSPENILSAGCGWWQRHHGLKEEGAQRLWGPTVKWSMEVSRGYNKNSLNSLLLVRFDLIKEERSPAEEAGKKLPRHCQPSRVVCVLKGSQ